MIKYKLTTQNLTTHNDFQWEIGIKQTTSGEGGLCGPGYLHYYHHPLLAVLLNPIHARIKNPKLFEVEAGGVHLDDNGLKGGCTEMTLIREIELPKFTDIQRVAFGILCAKEVYKDLEWNEWAAAWLDGSDRSRSAAAAAAHAAAYAAAYAAYYAADAAARAAHAAHAARAAHAAYYAADAAYAAYYAAAAAARNTGIDLIAIATKALEY